MALLCEGKHVQVSWGQVAAWRMRQQFLDTCTERPASDVVGRLCGVQSQVWSAAELAVALRQSSPDGQGNKVTFARLARQHPD